MTFSKKLSYLDPFRPLDLTLLIFILLTGCATKQNTVLEIVTPPILPEEFLTIPENTNDPSLKKLSDSNELISSISIGRNDPFLPPDFKAKSKSLFPPESFTYHGYLNVVDSFSAFVSYKNKTGTIQIGDLGGVTTQLLPEGWKVENLDSNSQVLKLSFDENFVNINLLDN